MTDMTSGREVEDDVGDVMCDAETEGGAGDFRASARQHHLLFVTCNNTHNDTGTRIDDVLYNTPSKTRQFATNMILVTALSNLPAMKRAT